MPRRPVKGIRCAQQKRHDRDVPPLDRAEKHVRRQNEREGHHDRLCDHEQAAFGHPVRHNPRPERKEQHWHSRAEGDDTKFERRIGQLIY